MQDELSVERTVEGRDEDVMKGLEGRLEGLKKVRLANGSASAAARNGEDVESGLGEAPRVAGLDELRGEEDSGSESDKSNDSEESNDSESEEDD